MSLRNGWLQGIGSMERRGDVTLTYEYPHLKVHASAGFKKLLVGEFRNQFILLLTEQIKIIV